MLSMIDTGVPLYIIRWLWGFLRNRQACVRYNGVLGKNSTMLQGLPQGSVLAPVLFVFYINNLAKLLPKSTVNALFADDVTILAQHKNKTKANNLAQKAVDIVNKWSKEWKLSLNASKSECCYFTLDRNPAESHFSPNIVIDGKPICHNPTPRLLGVILDRELTFTTHTDHVVSRMKDKHKMLRAIANSDWGWRKQTLRQIYLAFCRSLFDYAAIAWQPWIKEHNIKKLEVAQNKCIRIITGQPMRTHVEALRLESNIPSYQSMINASTMRGREKALRLPEDHPRKICLDKPPMRRPPPKKPRPNCRNAGIELCSSFDQTDRKPIILHHTPPWLSGTGSTTILSELVGIQNKSEDPAKIREAAYRQIVELNTEITIYSDGSADGGLKNGGSAAVITTGDPHDPTVIATSKKK